MEKSLLVLPLLMLIAMTARAQSSDDVASPLGRWITIDDARNEPRSLVRIYEQDGLLYAEVERIYLRKGEPENPTCEPCKGERKDQPIIGMTIMWDMKAGSGQWSGGRIIDPENGKSYRCKIWVEDGVLQVRGYLGPFYRTQTWKPAD